MKNDIVPFVFALVYFALFYNCIQFSFILFYVCSEYPAIPEQDDRVSLNQNFIFN